MLVGHKKQWEILKKSAEAGKLPHALLFSGQEKIGKKKVAFEFISSLFGQDIQRGAHPDFIFVESAGREIQISQIRDMNWRLSLKNLSAPFKAAIIDNADLMNIESQNCLLKTLEEPRGNAILILTTSHPKVLLPTIISRCRTTRFYPAKDSEIENYLIKKGLSKEKAKEIAGLSWGRPGVAIDFLEEPQKLEKHKKTILALAKIFDSDIAYRFQYAKSISEKSKSVEKKEDSESVVKGDLKVGEGPREILEIWLGYLRDVLISKLNGKEDVSFKNFSFVKLKNFIEALQKTIFLFSTQNINQRLALENLMLEL